jgi:arylamine N-acetyltransferase
MTFPFDEYCARTGAGSTGKSTYDRLEELQHSQLYSISYENFDIHLGRPIELSQARLIDNQASHSCSNSSDVKNDPNTSLVDGSIVP